MTRARSEQGESRSKAWLRQQIFPGGPVLAVFDRGDVLLRLDARDGGGMIVVLPARIREDTAPLMASLFLFGTVVDSQQAVPGLSEDEILGLEGVRLAAFTSGDFLFRLDLCSDGGAVLRLPAGVRDYPEDLQGLEILSRDVGAVISVGPSQRKRRPRAPRHRTGAKEFSRAVNVMERGNIKSYWKKLVENNDFPAMVEATQLLIGLTEAIGFSNGRKKCSCVGVCPRDAEERPPSSDEETGSQGAAGA